MAETSELPRCVAGGPGHVATPVLEVEFCGERTLIATEGPFGIGARTDLNLDTASTLPDELLRLEAAEGVWAVRQVASGAEAWLVADELGLSARLQPGRPVPVVFGRTTIRIATSRSRYELGVLVAAPLFEAIAPLPGPRSAGPHENGTGPAPAGTPAPGEDTAGPRLDLVLNREQRLLLTVLAAPVLRMGQGALSDIPSSVEAARMLRWPVTKFNRKLDTVCGRLTRAGVAGLHGGSSRPALNRRTRLVQIAVDLGLVTAEDLELLAAFEATPAEAEAG